MKADPVRPLAIAFSLAAVVVLTGCFDTKQEYTINPDGSGKVVHECRFKSPNMESDKQSLDESLHAAIRELIEKSKGVEAWGDVSFRVQEDGQFFFRGTAYFKRLSELSIRSQMMLRFDWQTEARGRAALSLRRDVGQNQTTDTHPATAETLQAARARYQLSKPMLAAIFTGMKQQTVFHLPGDVGESAAFEQPLPGTLRIEFQGEKLLQVLDQRMTDNEWLKQYISREDFILSGAWVLNEDPGLFGGPVRAVIKTTATPLFDYAAEVAAARKAFPHVLKQLGMAEPHAKPAFAPGEPVKNIHVTEVSIRPVVRRPSPPFPNNAGDGNYTLKLSGDLSGQGIAVEDGILQSALADDGSNLLPQTEAQRKIHLPSVSGKDSVAFEVRLKLPPPDVKFIKEISGVIRYQAQAGGRAIDLGFSELKTGAKGTQLGAQIQFITKADGNFPGEQLQLKLNLPRERLAGASLLVDGIKIPLAQRGYMGGSNAGTFVLESGQKFPARATLMADVFDDVQTFSAPFKLENVTLFGEALPGELSEQH